jgi:hypothetical protein
LRAKLFNTVSAVVTVPAGRQVMKADPVPDPAILDLMADFFNDPGDLVTQSQRQRVHARYARAIVRIGMTNAGSLNPNQDIHFVHGWDGDMTQLERFPGLNQANRFHRMHPGMVLAKTRRINAEKTAKIVLFILWRDVVSFKQSS